jgi:hypothetical protein
MGRTGFGWVRIGSSAGLCEHSNETSGSMKKAGCCFTSCLLFKEYPAPWSK